MSDNKKLILLLIGAVLLIGITLWLISPLRGESNILGTIFTGGGSEPTVKASGPEVVIDFTKDYQAVITTDKGEFTIDLLEDNAPFTVNNFVYLARQGFFDQSKFHRVISGFIVQTGLDKDGNAPDYTMADEINADSLGLADVKVKDASWLSGIYKADDASTATFSPTNLAKYADSTVKAFFAEALGFTYRTDIESVRADSYGIGMANAGPNTASSQFFIITANQPQRHLDGRFTIFGQVVEGFNVLQQIEGAGANQSKILSVEIIER